MPMLNTKAFIALQRHLDHHEAFLIEDSTDLFYLLQRPISTGSLLIEKNKMVLFVDGRYFQAFHSMEGLTTLPSEHCGFLNYLKSSALKKVFFDAEKSSYERGLHLIKTSSISFEPRNQLLRSERLIKTDKEIKLIRESAHLLVDIYEAFLKLPKWGLSEKQIAQQFKILSFEKGAEGFSFEPIIATGENTAFPHHRPTDRILRTGEPMLVDVGICKNNYQSDMTRMVFSGHTSQAILDMHDQVLKAHQAALALCQPGTPLGHLDTAARAVFKAHGTEHLFCHSLGHGLGLETHEAPRIKYDGVDKDLILAPGMVITIEPGLYQEGLGGIRHEDLIVITEKGHENFYPSYL